MVTVSRGRSSFSTFRAANRATVPTASSSPLHETIPTFRSIRSATARSSFAVQALRHFLRQHARNLGFVHGGQQQAHARQAQTRMRHAMEEPEQRRAAIPREMRMNSLAIHHRITNHR